ncbi:MAG: DUF4290 domain-containing protein [Bacteroidales bacterium]|nr:DUF4290 domain-containing protein [Bacteroidales bacterium]
MTKLKTDMEYNTTKQPLILPEYGRNVQMMADHLLTIQDKEKRTEAAKELVSIMINMNSSVRETKDYKQKMWDFLAQLCDYKLDVDFPFPITKATELPRPENMDYNQNEIRFRHYGYTVERMIKAAVELEDGEEKNILIRMIANNMKRNYVVWNQKSVTDEIIVNDLNRLSQGRLKLSEDVRLMNVNVQNPQQGGNKKNNNFKRNNQGKKNRNNNKNKQN